MRRTPVYDPFDDHDDPSHDPGPEVSRISTTPRSEKSSKRADPRPLHATRRPLPKRGPDPRVWFIRGSIGIAAMAGLWLGLQALFPVTESRVSQAPTPSQPIDASAVGAPEPPVAQPVVQQPPLPAPTLVPPVAPTPESDRLPGLPTPNAAAPAPTAQVAPPAPPAPAAEAAAPAPPTSAQEAAPAPAQPIAETKPRIEEPSQQSVGTPTLEPIPPPPAAQPSAPAAQARPAAPSAPAPKPQAPPPAPAGGGPFEVAASASPVNPVSEQANVTISVKATQNGAPLAGATCMATVHYRTATAKQPDGGFRTNANGVGSFTLDARNSTYGFYIPVDVTCSGRGGTATARTGFTPVKGR